MQGCDVHIVTSTAQFPNGHPAHQKRTYEYQTPAGVRVTVFNVRYSHLMGIPRRLWAFGLFFMNTLVYVCFKIKNYDIVYASSTPPSMGVLAHLLTCLTKVPFVLEVVDVWPDVPIGMKILQNKLIISGLNFGMNFIYRRAQKIVALSPDMKRQICAHQIPEQQVVVSFNGTNTRQFFPQQGCCENVQNKSVILLYAGTIGRANELTQLFPLAKELHNRKINAEIRVIGTGNKVNEFLVRLKAENLPNVVYQSAVSKQEIAAKMQEATFGVVCFAPYEVLAANSANKFYDYLAVGLPVVINYGGWQAKLLQEHHCGISGDFQNPRSLVDELVSIISDANRIRQMRQNARNLALTQFNRSDIALALLNLFNQLITTE